MFAHPGLALYGSPHGEKRLDLTMILTRLAMDCEYGAIKPVSSQSLSGCAGGSIRIQYSNAGAVSYSLLGPSVPFDPPITYRPYMPMLLQFCKLPFSIHRPYVSEPRLIYEISRHIRKFATGHCACE